MSRRFQILVAISALITTVAGIMTFIKNKEELTMNREKHSLDKELAHLKISSLKNLQYGNLPITQADNTGLLN